MLRSKPSYLFFALGIIIILILGILASAHFYEWYSIEILKNLKGYPFGGEGPTPYYYKTPELYALVNLVWGIIFTITFISALISIFKKSQIWLVATSGISILAISLMLIQG